MSDTAIEKILRQIPLAVILMAVMLVFSFIPAVNAEPLADLEPIVAHVNDSIYYYPYENGTFGGKVLIDTLGGNPKTNDMVGRLADFDRDGDLDLIIDTANMFSDAIHLQYYVNNGYNFTRVWHSTLPAITPVWGEWSRMTVADFDNDGYYDFIASRINASDKSFYLFCNNQNNTFTERLLTIDTGWAVHPREIEACDFNYDGKMDFLLGDYESGGFFNENVSLYSGDGTGNFSYEGLAFTVPNPVGTMVAGNFNNDTYPDVIAGLDDDGDAGAMWLFLNNGDGTFSSGGEVIDLSPYESGMDNPGSGYADAYEFDKVNGLDVVASVSNHSTPSGWFNVLYYVNRTLGGDVIEPENCTVIDSGVNLSLIAVSEEIGPTPTGTWVKLNGPYGAYIADLAVDPTNPKIIYAAIDGGGVYKSYDGGETWTEINEGITVLDAWDIIIDPTNPQILYVGTFHGGIFKTNNGGSTWQDVTDGITTNQVWDIAINPINPQTIYVATGDGIFKTTDGGNTWNPKNEGITNLWIGSIILDPTNPDVLFAGNWLSGTNWLYKSTNGGDTWFNSSSGLDSTAAITSITIDPVNSSIVYVGTDVGVFKSTDAAKGWIESKQGVINPYIRDLAIDPADHNILYAATWGGLLKSFDAGDSWTLISQDFITRFVKTVTFDPSNSHTIYAGVFGGIYKSNDAGESWDFYDNGLIMDVIVALRSIAIDPTNSKIIYVGTYGGGFSKTVDGGCSWYSINGETGIIDAPWANPGIVVNYENPQILYGGVEHLGTYKSYDAGKNWVHKSEGLTNRVMDRIRLDPVNPEILYLATRGGVFKSVDGADNWYPINEGLPDYWAGDVIVDPLNPKIIYVALRNNGIFKSINGGDSWFSRSAGISDLATECLEIDPSNTAIIYTGTRTPGIAGVFKSTDGGAHWIKTSAGIEGLPVQNLAIYPSNPQVIYAGTFGDGVFKSTDGGETWSPWNAGLLDLFISALIIDPENPSIVYAGTNRGLFMWTPSKAIVTSTDQNGIEKNEYYPEDDVWVKATGLSPDTNYKIWIQLNPVNEGDTLDPDEGPSGAQETVTTDGNGNFENKLIRSNIPSGPPWNVEYDIVVDKQGVGEVRIMQWMMD